MNRLAAVAGHMLPCRVRHVASSARGSQSAPPAAAAEAEEDVEPTLVAALEAAGGEVAELRQVPWGEVLQHNTVDDLWVAIDGIVYDMTDFVSSDHPGGEEIPTEYAGKDATAFWNDIHGHLKAEIFEDLAAGEGSWTGLDLLPSIIGRVDGPPPADAQGRLQPLRWQEKNWSGFVQWSHGHGMQIRTPSTVAEVQEIVRCASKVRVLGRGHGFPAICDQSDKDGVMVALLPNMNKVLDIDSSSMTVTVEGGCVWSVLIEALEGTGLALENLQSIGHITVAGGVATGSHGSSTVDPNTGRARLASSATLVCGLELVIADGSVVEYLRDGNPEVWAGLVTNLGLHGVVTKLTLDLVPDNDMHVWCYEDIPAEHFIKSFQRMLRTPDCSSFNAMVRWPMEKVHCGYQHLIPAGSLVEAPDVPPAFFGAGTLVPSDTIGRGSRFSNSIVRWHRSVIMSNHVNDTDVEEYQLELFVPLEYAEDTLRVTFSYAKEHWGESAAEPSASMNYHHVRFTFQFIFHFQDQTL